MYEEIPEGVSFPRNLHDIQSLVKRSIEEGFSITARSAGTSLAGQATGSGVIMDGSRYMTTILEMDAENRTATVQPGVIRDTLNLEASRFNLQFGPDTATTNRCMLGGMIGNNSCGSFSIKYQTTREHLLEVEAVLSDGSTARFKALQPEELEKKCKLQNLEGQIYRQMLDLLKKNKETILRNFPHPEITRRNTGYAIDRLCEMDPITPGGRPFNLAELLCGSEGTLAITASAKVNLVPLPKNKILLIPQFTNLHEAMLATVEAVRYGPSAVELVDDIILDATKGNIEQKRNRFFLAGEPRCILIIEFEGESAEEIHSKAEQLSEKLMEMGLGYEQKVVSDREKMAQVWNLRKAGLGLLMGLGSENRSPTFVEDTAVRVQDLPDFVKDFKKILARYETRCVFYAHASVGELHLRPIVDTKSEEGVRIMKEMAMDVALLVREYRGSLSGEHGDGRARAPFIETVLGSEVMPLLRQVKEIWDPDYRLNPGKILDPAPMDSDLRYSPDYRQPEVKTEFNWRKEGGFPAAIEQCNGAGVCRKLATAGGTMCPSYHATREEKDSTRGRANLFRQLFAGEEADAFRSEDLKEALELCLSCKACKSECPANVDMAKMKAEFTHGWHKEHGSTVADYFFGHPEKFYPVASLFPGAVNFMSSRKGVKRLVERAAGIDSRRELPQFAPQTFERWYKVHGSEWQVQASRQVVLLVDIFTNYHEPEIAIAALKVLTHLGYQVVMPGVWPTGRPQISKGFLEEAKSIAEKNIRRFGAFAEMDIPIVGLEPSEILTLRDEYMDLCDDESVQLAEKIAAKSFLFEEFLYTELAAGNIQKIGNHRKIYIHDHCHTKALVGSYSAVEMFKQFGFEPVELKTGCCGMAGSFGYQKDKYEVSMKVGEQTLFPMLRNLPQDAVVCAPGFSCRHQISDGTDRKANHPAVILAGAL